MFKMKILSVILIGSIGSAFASTTTFEINNNTSSDETLISTDSTGIISPVLPTPLSANETTTHFSNTAGSVEAGRVTYLSCRFNWSAIKIGSFYTFSIGATPSDRCRSQVLQQNFVTGDYSIKFDIDE